MSLFRNLKFKIVCLILALAGIGVKLQNKSEADAPKLIVGYHLSTPFSELDTTNITDIYQSILLDNLLGKLVEMNSAGQLVSDLCESFRFQDNKLIFSFSENIKTSSGEPITAKDAEISIKRTLLRGSTHVQLKSYLCGTDELKNLDQACAGIYTQGNNLILETEEPTHLQFILPMLTAVEFSILPRKQIGPNGEHLGTYEESTGPYHVERITKDLITLKSNKYYHHISAQSPSEVNLRMGDMDQIDEWLRDGTIDTLTTTTGATKDWETMLASGVYNLSETGGIKLYYLQFTPSGVKRTTFEQRAYLAQQFQEVMESQEYGFNPHARKTIQFFQEMSTGHLNDEQKAIVSASRKIKDPPSFEKPVKFLAYSFLKQKMNFFSKIENIVFEWIDRVPPTASETDADFYLLTNDTAFNEDITLMSYNFSIGTFGVTKENGVKWLKSYMKESDVKKRLTALNELHFESLRKGIIFPLFSAPYSVLSRKPWQANLAHFFADNKFYAFRKSQ